MGLFDRLRGNDTPRVAFIGIDGLPTASSPTTRTRFRRCRRSPTRATGTDRQRCAARVERVLAGAHKWCEPGETGVYGFQDREVGSYDTYVPMGRDDAGDARGWE